ncbi:hypothetical protein B5M09_014050, partial [Aphanomyces astaci]
MRHVSHLSHVFRAHDGFLSMAELAVLEGIDVTGIDDDDKDAYAYPDRFHSWREHKTMAAALVEYIHEALDRNEAPHLVRICRSTGCSLQEGQDAMTQILTQEKDVQSVHVVVSTVINPETNTIAGKTISLVRGGDPDDETDLYAVYRSTESSSGSVDDALKNIMWFPRLDEGLGGIIASDIACDAASSGARNLVLKAAESASVFSNFKSTGTTKST